MLINVTELGFPRGGGYPRVGGQGNGHVQEGMRGFLEKGTGVAVGGGWGNAAEERRARQARPAAACVHCCLRWRVNLGRSMMSSWHLRRPDAEFGTWEDQEFPVVKHAVRGEGFCDKGLFRSGIVTLDYLWTTSTPWWLGGLSRRTMIVMETTMMAQNQAPNP